MALTLASLLLNPMFSPLELDEPGCKLLRKEIEGSKSTTQANVPTRKVVSKVTNGS